MVKAELEDMRDVLFQVKRGKVPRNSAAFRTLQKANAVKVVKKGKKFGDVGVVLTPKGRRFVRVFRK